MNFKRNHELCTKAVTGQLDENEKRLFDLWLAESESNRAEFENIRSLWNKTIPEEIPQIPDIDAAWINLNNKIESLERKAKQKSPVDRVRINFQSLLRPAFKPAFISVIMIVIMLGVWFVWNGDTTDPNWKSVTTANKEQREVRLPDGSIVFLNSSSSLRYDESFDGDLREVKLDGEAFFSVTKSLRPFVVVTGNAKTTVLGTKFNVWARDEQTRVIVKEGLVKLASIKANKNGVKLPANYSGVIVKDEEPSGPLAVNPDLKLGWMDGKLIFDHTPLPEIVKELQRYYDKQIIIENAGINSLSLTGTFGAHGIDSTLSMICLALDIAYKKDQNGYRIKTK